MKIAGGSTTGKQHRHPIRPSNCQDYYTFGQDETGRYWGIVCDGCGSERHSEFGATLLAELTHGYLRTLGDLEFRKDALEAYLSSAMINILVNVFGGDDKYVYSHFLSTMMLCVVDNVNTRIIAYGDGYYVLNDAQGISISANNRPNYFAYRLLKNPPTESKETLDLVLPNSRVESLIIGSDGMEDFERSFYAGAQPVGLDDLLADNIFLNKDMVNRKLAMAAHCLRDDTTLVVFKGFHK